MTIENIDFGRDFFVIAGPCLVEGEEMLRTTAERLAGIGRTLDVPIILKGSFKKANRTSNDSPMTIGEREALGLLSAAGNEFGLPTLTDIHTESDAATAAEFVDVLQIPAFLCRQTELIRAAAETGKWVNIKKGQFLAPEDMAYAVGKARAAGSDRVMVCERGTTFGYHNLVVDMRSLLIMRGIGVPVVFDATHSTQRPSAGTVSGGDREYALPLARAAAAIGIDGLFFETHPDPASAMSDAATQIPLQEAEEFIRQTLAFTNVRRNLEGFHV